jgi:GPN-loop GTPase
MMYCLEYLHANLDWLEDRLAPFRDAGYYFLFDCPGQAELYTHHEAFWRIVQRLGKQDYNVSAKRRVSSGR